MPSPWPILVLFCSATIASAAEEPYFPPRALALTDGGDGGEYHNRWFSDALRRMNEPSLWAASRADPNLVAYRVLWLPSSYDSSLACRIEKVGDRLSLRRVALDPWVGDELGAIHADERRDLDQATWDRLAGLFTTTGFRDMPTRIGPPGLDGDEWIIEGVEGGKYHVVNRWTPGPGPFRDLGRALLNPKLAGPAPSPAPSIPTFIAAVAAAILLLLGLRAVGRRLGHRFRKPRRPRGLDDLS